MSARSQICGDHGDSHRTAALLGPNQIRKDWVMHSEEPKNREDRAGVQDRQEEMGKDGGASVLL